MTAWSSHAIRHPWFNPPAMKRRLSASDDDDDGDDSSFFSDPRPPPTLSTSRRKRVRYDSLERTMAHMTLGGASVTPSEDVDMWPKTSLPCLSVHAGSLNVMLPSPVEEPDTPTFSETDDMDVELVTFDTSATTAPAIDDWKGTESGQLDIKQVQISSAVLECLRRQIKCPPPLIPTSSQSSQALVLYRPPGLLSEPVQETQEEKPAQRVRRVTHADDVMEVE